MMNKHPHAASNPTHKIGNRFFSAHSISGNEACLSAVEVLPTIWPDGVTWRYARAGTFPVRVAVDGSWRDPQTLLSVELPLPI